MGSFGQRLQREREMRGITLEEIAASTKIGTRSLRALEDEDFDQLPGGIFNKGFVRAYSKYLGIDEEQAVADFMIAAGEAEPPLPTPPDPGPPPEAQSRAGGWLAVVAVLVLAAGGFGGWKFYQHRQDAAAQGAAAESTAVEPAQPLAASAGASELQSPPQPGQADSQAAAQVAEAGAIPAPGNEGQPGTGLKKDATPAELSAKPAAAEDGFLLEIRARQDSWISYTVDDKPARELQLKPADLQSIRARKNLKLVLGNAGGVDISHNGRALPQLGPENKTRVVYFTPQGLQR